MNVKLGKAGFNPYQLETIVAVDYDGTLVDNDLNWIQECIKFLKLLQSNGVRLIMWSCRPKSYLQKEMERLNREEGIKIEYINENLPEIVEGYEEESRKIFAHFYVDDAAIAYGRFDWTYITKKVLDHHFYREL